MILQDSSRINLAGARILAVDDNAKSLKILTDLLVSFGATHLSTASNGKEAKALLSASRFDLLITDGAMPECDGYDLVRWLRSRPGDDERIIPAIIISAHTREEQIVLGRDCGAHFVIAKPISPATLLERIFWISSEARNFIVADTYAGPDRRWRQEPLPRGVAQGRRRDDPAPKSLFG
jgi:CheY-like chemotaxis protein